MDAREQLTQLQGQLRYVKEKLSGELLQWERNEFTQLERQYEDEIAELDKHIDKHKEIFDEPNMFKQDEHGNQWNQM